MNNVLKKEKSLYLQQHQDSLIYWQTWGREAWEQAQREKKIVILSIGYASCHGCHLMAQKTFKHPYVIKLMNEHFVCIKMDREEYPALDQFYLDAVQMIIGKAGWPLNIFCLPDGRPFMGGTYFPAEDEGHGIIPWPQLIMRILNHYQRNSDELIENATAIIQNFQHINTSITPKNHPPLTTDDLINACKRILKTHDDLYGGFGHAAKFPQTLLLNSLITATQQALESETFKRITCIVDKSLTAMAHGAMHDTIEGGFMRYTTDREWTNPHSEKMLYDNALLIKTYAKGYILTKNPYFLEIIQNVLTYLNAHLKSSNGLYYSSQSAFNPSGSSDFYQWDEKTLKEAFSPEAYKEWMQYYPIPKEKNKYFLSFQGDWPAYHALNPHRKILKNLRAKRIQPLIDQKILIGWNALLICNLLDISEILYNTDYLYQAKHLLDVLLSMSYQNQNLAHMIYEETPYGTGDCFDYASVLNACLKIIPILKQLSLTTAIYEEIAKNLMHTLITKFKDTQYSGFFNDTPISYLNIIQYKSWQDYSLPTANSLTLENLHKFNNVFQDNRYENEYVALKKTYAALILEQPNTVAYALNHFLESIYSAPN